MRKASLTKATVVATLALLVLSTGMVITPFGKVQAATNTITLVSSCLVASDSLTSGSTSSWTSGGDAASQSGAKFTYSEDSQDVRPS